MRSFILNFWLALIRQSWRLEIFTLLTRLHTWPKIQKLLILGTQGAGYLHDIGNTTMIIRFLHADFAHQLTNRQNRELTTQLEYLSTLIIEGQNLLSEEELSSQYFDVRECIHECLHLFNNHPLGKDCSVQIKGKKDFDLFGPSILFTQAMLNILQNSAQALQGQKKKIITLSLVRKQNTFMITIEDNGPGFPKGFQIQPFVTTKQDGNGIGLWHSLLQLRKHFTCTYTCTNASKGGAQTKLYFWKPL